MKEVHENFVKKGLLSSRKQSSEPIKSNIHYIVEREFRTICDHRVRLLHVNRRG